MWRAAQAAAAAHTQTMHTRTLAHSFARSVARGLALASSARTDARGTCTPKGTNHSGQAFTGRQHAQTQCWHSPGGSMHKRKGGIHREAACTNARLAFTGRQQAQTQGWHSSGGSMHKRKVGNATHSRTTRGRQPAQTQGWQRDSQQEPHGSLDPERVAARPVGGLQQALHLDTA